MKLKRIYLDGNPLSHSQEDKYNESQGQGRHPRKQHCSDIDLQHSVQLD